MNQKKQEELMSLMESAIKYLNAQLKEGKKDGDADYPLNRGDIVVLVMLIDKELPSAASEREDPLNGKRLAAIRKKLGNLAIDAPKMSKAEAQQFRE